MVIVSAAAVLAEISIANLIKIKEAEKKLKTSLSAAKKSVSLKTMVNTGQIDNLSLYWGLATKRSGLKAPSAVLAAAKQAYAAKGYK